MLTDLQVFASALSRIEEAGSERVKRNILHQELVVRWGIARFFQVASDLKDRGLSSKEARWEVAYVRDHLETFTPRAPTEILFALEQGWWDVQRSRREWCAFVLKCPKGTRWAINRVLDGQLRCGLSRDTIREVLRTVEADQDIPF